MWNSVSALSAVGTWGLWFAAVLTMCGTIAALVGGVAANRAADITRTNADIRIAEANQRAEEARLETVRLWEKVAWRRLEPEQRTAIIKALQGSRFTVQTAFVGSDGESTIFRNEIDEALRAGGLETQYHSGYEVALGLKIIGLPSEDRDRLEAAFNAAGLTFSVESKTPQRSAAPLVVLVGSRPEPTR